MTLQNNGFLFLLLFVFGGKVSGFQFSVRLNHLIFKPPPTSSERLEGFSMAGAFAG